MQKSSARSALRVAVYCGVVLLLVALALFFRPVTASVGDARVTGRYALLPLFQSRDLRDLTLSWNGMALRFSGSTSPALKGFETTANGTDIIFDADMRLRLSPGSDAGGSLAMTRIGSTGGSPLIVPFTMSGVEETSPAAGTLGWRRAGRSYLLELPAGAQVDEAARTLLLPTGAAAWTARLSTQGTPAMAAAISTTVSAAPARVTAAATRLPDEKAMPTDEQLRATLAHFVDAAFAGWSATRLSTADAQWKMPDGSLTFSEDIGVGLLAEALARGSWQQYLPIWSDALARQQKRAPDAQLSFSTSPYVGGVRDYARSVQTQSAALVDKAGALLSKADDAVLSVPGLVPLLMDHGSAELLKSAGTFLTSHAGARLDTNLSVGLLESLLDYDRLVDAGDAVSRALKDTVEKDILPRVRMADGGEYLDSGDGTSDLETGIRCGGLLIHAGGILSSSLASAVGRGLVSSALALAGNDGMLPATVSIGSGHVGQRKGTLAPESVYAVLPIDRDLPQEIPLPQLGQGAWIWTAARVRNAQKTDAQITLVLSYPQGVAHNFVLQGAKPFTQVRLHGISWHTDPTYFKYSDGWAYDTTSQTFFVKLTGKSDREEMDILY